MKAIRICMQNIRKWTSNKRVIFCLFFGLLFVYSYTGGLRSLSDVLEVKMSPWLFPFLFTSRSIKIVFMAIIIFIFCDAPFIDSNQAYIMLRSGRKIWNTGQLIYIIIGSALYMLILMAGTVVLNIGHIGFNMNWGKVLGVAATNPSVLDAMGKYSDTIKISARVVRYFSPLQAMFFSALLMWLSFILIGLVIYVFNMITHSKIIGVLIASFLVLLTAFVDSYPLFNKFSPISWNSLNTIDIAGLTTYPTIDYILISYIVIICVLIISTYIYLNHFEINICNEF